jgi:nucleoid-associated protein YgaU
VQPGDTFASLAQAYYGASNHADFLMKANPDVDPAKMQIGATIRVPALADRNSAKATPVAGAARKSASMAAATKTYTVRPGDSFYRIAEEQLGDATRWNELFELIKTVVGTDPSRLKVGQVLSLPSK